MIVLWNLQSSVSNLHFWLLEQLIHAYEHLEKLYKNNFEMSVGISVKEEYEQKDLVYFYIACVKNICDFGR